MGRIRGIHEGDGARPRSRGRQRGAARMTHRAILVFGRAFFVNAWDCWFCLDLTAWNSIENSRCVMSAVQREDWGRDDGAVVASELVIPGSE